MSVTTTLTPLDIVRLEIGDRDITNPLFTDNEISYYVNKRAPNVLLAAADCLDALAARFAAGIDFTTDTLSVKKLQRAQIMADLATSLRSRATGTEQDDFVKIDGFSQSISNTSTHLTEHENIDPDIPRYGSAWEGTLTRQQGDNYVPGSRSGDE